VGISIKDAWMASEDRAIMNKLVYGFYFTKMEKI